MTKLPLNGVKRMQILINPMCPALCATSTFRSNTRQMKIDMVLHHLSLCAFNFIFFFNNDLFSVWFAREVSFLWRLRRIDVVDSIRTKSKRRNLRGKRLWWVLLAKTDCKLIFRWRNFVYKLWSWPSWMAQAIFRWLFWLQLFVALLLLCSSPLFDDFVAMVVVVFVASPVERKRTAAKFNMKMQ